MKYVLISLFIFLFVNPVLSQINKPIPYPNALDNSAVTQSTIDNVISKAMYIGNGDINALIYSQNGDVYVNMTKNDIIDARINSENDPTLGVVDIENHSISNRVTTGSVHDVTPIPLPAGRLKIASGTAITSNRLDFTKAKGEITTNSETTTIRSLAQRNVFHIETGRNLTLEPIPQNFIPNSTSGITQGYQWIRQTLPGDLDLSEEHFYVVLGSRTGEYMIAIVTSRESQNPLDSAIELIKTTLSESKNELILSHETQWENFWSKSGVELGEKRLERWWYRMLYFLRIFAKPGVQAIGVYAGYFNQIPFWHSSYTVNYNFQQTHWPSFNSNHNELFIPYFDVIYGYHKRAQWIAQTLYQTEGAAVVHNLYPYEPDPANSISKNKRQIAYFPWAYTMGLSGHVFHNLWLNYLFYPDRTYLSKIYPMIKDYGTFYASFVEQCKVQSNGKVALGPSVDPEHTYPGIGAFGIDNSAYDIAFTRFTLKIAIQAANELRIDSALVTRWQNALDKVPNYFTAVNPADNQSIVQSREGGVVGEMSYNITSPTTPVFPAEQINWFSDQSEKDLFQRTIEWIDDKYNRNNSVIMLNIAKARLSMTNNAITDVTNWFSSKELPNGTFAWWQWPAEQGSYWSEQTAITGMINEFLLQSVENIIRVFPAWPQNQDAKFTDLRAQGGFLVTAEQSNGTVSRLEITSTVGGELKLLSPWNTILYRHPDGGILELSPDNDNIVQLNTEVGKKYIFDQNLTSLNKEQKPPFKINLKIYKSLNGSIYLPNHLIGRTIRLYNVEGRFLNQLFVKKNKINLDENFGSKNLNLFIVKTLPQ